MENDIPTRSRILYQGAKLTSGDRDAQYGPPVKNMQDIAVLWNSFVNLRFPHGLEQGYAVELNGEDVAHMMTLLKIARSLNRGPLYTDNYVDGATYQGIAGECAESERA